MRMAPAPYPLRGLRFASPAGDVTGIVLSGFQVKVKQGQGMTKVAIVFQTWLWAHGEAGWGSA